jgi:PHP family Zn ribbon phosphoesterase
MLVQLEEIIAEGLGVGVKTIKVKNLYQKLVTELDNELKILTKVEIPLIANVSGNKVAEGVKRVREGKLTITPGFDNTYGKVKIFSEKENPSSSLQVKLF